MVRHKPGEYLKMAENQIFEFFRNLDKHGTGRIGREDFHSVCAEYIEPVTAANITDDIFCDLSSDVNGEVSIKDLLQYVRGDTINDGYDPRMSPKKRHILERRRSDARLAWMQLIDGMGEPTLKKMMNTSGRQLEEVYHELQTYNSASPNLVIQFEGALSSLLLDVKQVLEDNENLKKMFNKEKEKHREQLRGLEEELDAHVAKVEEEVREQARRKFEQEKNEMMNKMDTEMAEMEARLKLSQKMNQILNKKKENNNSEYESAVQNSDFCSTIIDAKTNLALVQSEMAKIKADYETKCRELNDHQEMVMHYIDQNKNIQRHLDLLHKANRSLQDTNDGLISAIKTTGGRVTPRCGSRASSETNSTSSEAAQTLRPPPMLVHNVSNINQSVLHDQTNDNGAQYVIQRLMEDIDSGHSTFRDPVECDSDRKSVMEYPSDGEYALKSLESDDSKNSRLSSKRRIQCRAEFINSNPNSFEVVTEPDRTYKVVLAGDAAVGKSCFIHRFCKGTFTSKLGSTLGVDFQIKTVRVDEKNIAIQLWDTAGQERFRSMTKTYFRRADGVVLLYDITSEKSFLNIREWVQSINESTDKRIPILICGNKVDLRDDMKTMGAQCVETKTGLDLACNYNAIFYETSSKTGKNIMDALISITREMLLREDVEVQTSVLSINTAKTEKKSCC